MLVEVEYLGLRAAAAVQVLDLTPRPQPLPVPLALPGSSTLILLGPLVLAHLIQQEVAAMVVYLVRARVVLVAAVISLFTPPA